MEQKIRTFPDITVIEGTAGQAARAGTQGQPAALAIETQGLTKVYGPTVVVDHLTITVHRGEIFGFLGPNGAGKTTTMRMLLGLVKPTSGSAQLLGMDTATHLPSILARTGAVIENPTFYPYLSGPDNLRAVARLTRCSEARIPDILKLMDLTSAANKPFRAYSL